jgi:hypothetical protein
MLKFSSRNDEKNPQRKYIPILKIIIYLSFYQFKDLQTSQSA